MSEESPQPNPELLLQLVNMKMPFGKYKGTILCDLPVSYLEWFQRKGFPKEKLGMLLQTIYGPHLSHPFSKREGTVLYC